MARSYRFKCRLDPQTALDRIQNLLADEGVSFKVIDSGIVSTRTPFALLSFDPVLYTNKNWVGFNPFVYVSGVNVHCRPATDGTLIEITINQFRSFLFVGLFALFSFSAALVMPQPAGVIQFVVVILVASLWFVSFLGGHLIKREIRSALK